MAVPILKQAQYLIATIQSAPSDSDLRALQAALPEEVGKFRSRGVIVDVAAPDVFGWFASCIPVASLNDVVTARLEGRSLAERLGFTAGDATLVATAISELARNIVQHAGHGDIVLRSTTDGARHGIVVVARDRGPGIADPNRAVRSHDSTSGRHGQGLPGVRRMMDDFRIVSSPQDGTTVTVTKWKI